MVNYFKELFTKPKYQWTALDDWAVTGLILLVLFILLIVYYTISLIIAIINDKKYNKCNNKDLSSNYCYRKECLSCKKYKCKKEKK